MTNAAIAKKTNGQSNEPKMEVKKNTTVENTLLNLEKRIQKEELFELKRIMFIMASLCV